MKKEIKNKIGSTFSGLKECFVAGGTLTSIVNGLPINDYDIYPKSKNGLKEALSWCFENQLWCVHVSDRALTFSDKQKSDNNNLDYEIFQIMIFDTYPTAQDIFDKFDFTINMAAFDLDSGEFFSHKNFLMHNSQRKLKFNENTLFPYASVSRARKYINRGYNISHKESFKMLMACQNNPINSWDDLKKQAGGFYGHDMIVPDEKEYSFKRALKAIDKAEIRTTGGNISDNLNHIVSCLESALEWACADEERRRQLKKTGASSNPSTNIEGVFTIV